MRLALLLALAYCSVLGRAGSIFGGDGSAAAFRRVQAAARGKHVSTLQNPHHPRKSSLLPLAERLKREHGVVDNHHPQLYEVDELPWGGARRRAQSTACSGELTVECTRQLQIRIDFGAFHPSTAKAFSTCFEVGGWFKWNFPSTAAPPCESAILAGQTGFPAWIRTTQNSCTPGAAR